MKKQRILTSVLAVALLLALTVGLTNAQGPGPQGDVSVQAAPVGTAFTYQGRLTDGGSPANGDYDFEFELYDDSDTGTQVGSTVTVDDKTVTDGLFTVELNFGSGAFNGDARYLEIGVRPGGSTGAYTPLLPRQALTPTPYALSLRPGASVVGAIAGDNVVYAKNTATSSGGTGVAGEATATSGYNFGVRGLNHSASGTGVYGWAGSGTSGTDGRPYGVYGYSNSGHGVYGTTLGDWNWLSGVYGKAFMDHANGVTGWNTGGGTGVYAWSETGTGMVAKSGGSIFRGYDISPSDDLRFHVTNSGEVYADGSFHSGGADFAEMLPAVEGLEPGDVLVIGLDGQLLRSSSPYATGVMGVYSTEPGFIGGSNEEMGNPGKAPLAIVGIVPVKASAENGPIAPGDLLTTSSTPGHAMFADHFVGGAIIGKALEPLEENTGIIQMLVMLQ